ncbi:MAG: hypothetical protein GX444_04020 [Myxococcales bacterium]|nr:hypothetical protein [Myxococcales bacterium]
MIRSAQTKPGEQWIWGLSIVSIMTGFWFVFSSSWTDFYLAALFLHPLVSFIWCTIFNAIWLRRIVEKNEWGGSAFSHGFFLIIFGAAIAMLIGNEDSPAGAIVAIGGLAVVYAVALLLRWYFSGRRGVDLFNTWTFYLIVLAICIVIPLKVAPENRGAFLLLGSALLVSTIRFNAFLPAFSRLKLIHAKILIWSYLVTCYSGVMIFVLRLGRTAQAAFSLHRISSFLLTASLLLWLLRWLAAPGNRSAIGVHLRRFAFPVGLFFLLLIGSLIDARTADPSFTLHLSTIPMAEREPAERIKPLDFKQANLLELTESCGRTADCHPDILADHLKSTHNRSMQTPYFQKNLDLMIAEIGAENANLCAGCHHPQSLFDSSQNYRDFADRHNMSCVFCHVADAVQFPPDLRRSVLTLKPNLRHLARLAPDQTGDVSVFGKMLINLFPPGHGRALQRKIQYRDEFCQVCHRLQIKPTNDIGLERGRCIDCHMQSRADLGLSGSVRNHLFPGSNTATPFANRDYEQVEFIRCFLKGQFPIQLRAWGQVVDLDEDNALRIWLKMNYEPRSAVMPGEKFKFILWTSNIGVDHAFPAAPLDLIEVWIEVRVTDADDALVFQSGGLDAEQQVLPGSHRLGGYMIGKDGNIVKMNRVWQIEKKIVERQIAFGQRIGDEFETVLPDHAPGPLRLTAVWQYRKLSQDFVDWAYDRDGTTMPVAEIARFEMMIPLDQENAAEKTDQTATDEIPGLTSPSRILPTAHP